MVLQYCRSYSVHGGVGGSCGASHVVQIKNLFLDMFFILHNHRRRFKRVSINAAGQQGARCLLIRTPNKGLYVLFNTSGQKEVFFWGVFMIIIYRTTLDKISFEFRQESVVF